MSEGIAKVLSQKELKEYKCIDELLPHENDYCIILLQDLQSGSCIFWQCTESAEVAGHWVALLKYHGEYELFDSLGGTSNNYMNDATFKHLLQNKKVYLNHVPFQCNHKYIKTCGHHVVHRVFQFADKQMTLSEYVFYMSCQKLEQLGDFDMIVSNFVLDRYRKIRSPTNYDHNFLCS